MSVLPAIIDWIKGRPAWQQAAFQLLYDKGTLTSGEERYVADLCRRAAGLTVDIADPPPLDLGGAASPDVGGAVVLLGVRSLQHVNALHESEELSFGESGVTLIFGDNGAGKSSYVRVLKQVCRARGKRDPIQGNVFANDTEPPSATVLYRDVDGQDNAFEWKAGAEPPEALRQVSILDNQSAIVYVDGQQDVAYLPQGLDLLVKLATICDRVRLDLEREAELEAAGRRWPTGVGDETDVAELLSNLSSKAARDRLVILRGLDAAGQTQLGELRKERDRLQSQDPLRRATELDLRAKRVAAALERLRVRQNLVSEEAAASLVALRAEAAEAERVAGASADAIFDKFPLKGLTEETWSRLWSAAVEFAARGANPPQPFPPPPGSLCVLCQQAVGPEASSRLAAFRAFLGQETRAVAEAKKKNLMDRVAAIERDIAAPIDDTIAAELDHEDGGLGLLVCTSLSDLGYRGEEISANNPRVRPMSESTNQAISRCDALRSRLGSEAASYRDEHDQGGLATVVSAIANHDARVAIDRQWDLVQGEIERAQRLGRIDRAQKSASTRSITSTAKELVRALVSEPLAAEFRQILTALRLDDIPITLTPASARKGTAMHAVRLGPGTKLVNSDILSTGEFRAAAIAAFLAEVRQTGTRSTVVFDDPMSSMDLDRREYVAKALVDLARTRPVVVFTHDLVFVLQVTDASEDAAMPLTERQLRRSGKVAGFVSPSIAVGGKSAKSRIGSIRNRLPALRKLFESDPERYEQDMRTLYLDLRETWERGVEDSLLNGGIRRFGREIKTQSFKNLHRVTEGALKRLENGMTRCSMMMHDPAAPIGRPVPSPDAVEADVVECEQWIKELKSLHN